MNLEDLLTHPHLVVPCCACYGFGYKIHYEVQDIADINTEKEKEIKVTCKMCNGDKFLPVYMVPGGARDESKKII